MNNMTMPEWMRETLSKDPLRIYENGKGKIIISRVADRYPELVMTPEDIIKFLRGVKKKPVVMHPNEPFMGRHVAKREVIEILQNRMNEGM
jgi:hypothetical protein